MFKHSRAAIGVIAVCLAILTLTACSAPQTAAQPPRADEAPASAGEGAKYTNAVQGTADQVSFEATSGSGASQAERKIIREASLDIECDDARSVYGQLSDYAGTLGGHEFSYDIQNFDTYAVINAVLKVPPERLGDVVARAEELGKVINSRMGSEDITNEYYDTETRLESKRQSLQRYYALLEKADSLDGVAEIMRIIDGITEDIEAAEGSLKLMNELAGMATVTLYIRQENDPVKIEKEINWSALSLSDIGTIVGNGLTALTSGIVTFFEWVLIVLAIAS
ncbi:MAG: DUF4349 domain-containing protein, partial [Oscillospiraceae bacterium]|nr:DUF4349 domain-containing protein [Oscillospiraceae bacterium]